MYVLILMVFLWGDASHAGHGGAGVEIEKFDTREQCEIVKGEFLDNMKISHKQLVTGGRYQDSKITRSARCVKI